MHPEAQEEVASLLEALADEVRRVDPGKLDARMDEVVYPYLQITGPVAFELTLREADEEYPNSLVPPL